MTKLLPLCAIALLFTFQSKSQVAPSHYTSCPNGSIAILRAGLNGDFTNPNFLYNVNNATGAMTLVPGGPFKDPLSPSSNLQVNAIGVNGKDGFIYAMNPSVIFATPTNTIAYFYRLGPNYGASLLGYLPSPVTTAGTTSFINTGAGEMDQSGNYYFTAATVDNSTAQLTHLYFGKVSNVKALTSGTTTTPVAVTYNEIDLVASCTEFASTFKSNPLNSGLKDFSYNPATNTFFTYATYQPSSLAGTSVYQAQMAELRPINGSDPLKYEMACTQVINMNVAETVGTAIDALGNFLVLLTDGTVLRMSSSGAFAFTGQSTMLNNSTGLPNPLRGDMSVCNSTTNAPLPVRLSSFNVAVKDCNNAFTWTAANEADFNRYELEQSSDNIVFSKISTVASRRSNLATSYKVNIPSAGKQQYYRLKVIDDNGSFSYSQTLSVANTCASKFGFVVSPNPVSRQLSLNWYGIANNTQVNIIILNAYGAVMSKATKAIPEGASTFDLDVSNLPKGAYWIKAVDITGNKMYQNTFIKQ